MLGNKAELRKVFEEGYKEFLTQACEEKQIDEAGLVEKMPPLPDDIRNPIQLRNYSDKLKSLESLNDVEIEIGLHACQKAVDHVWEIVRARYPDNPKLFE